MEKLLAQVLVTFTLGFLVIGVVIGLQPVGDCGSVFSPDKSCPAGSVSDQLSLVLVFFGLGLTGLVAAILNDITRTKPATEPEPRPDVDQD